LGPSVAKVADGLGQPFMAWQRRAVDTALELDDDGKPAYRTVVVLVPRQNGKTLLQLALRVHRAVHPCWGSPQRIAWTAQSRVAARLKLVDVHEPMLARSAFAGVYRPRWSTGQEGLLWRNGSIDLITASGESSAHGETLHLGVADEAWAQPEGRLEAAFRPAMATVDTAQLWVISTAGKPDVSTWLWGKVEAGRQRALDGLTSDVCYLEWSAPDDADPGSLDTWKACMPALGVTVSPQTVASDYASMDPVEFARAYLNRWPTAATEPVFGEGVWEACAAPGVRTEGRPSFAFDTNPERTASAVAACSDRGDRVVVEVVEHRPGTDWVVPRLVELAERWDPKGIACDAAGPAGSLLADLAERGLDVKVANTRDATAAAGMFYDAVAGGRLTHPDQKALNAAVAAADRRTVADAWLWSRKTSTADISPLVACTLALWAHRQALAPAVEPWVVWR
jgi:phage terminase large subunit-like protein